MRERFFAWRAAAALATVILLAGSSGFSLARDDHDHSQRPWLGVTLGDTRNPVLECISLAWHYLSRFGVGGRGWRRS